MGIISMRGLRIGLLLLGAMLLIPTVVGFTGRWWWVADLFDQFRIQLAVGLLCVGLARAFVKPRKWALLWAAGVGVNLMVIVAAGWDSTQPMTGDVNRPGPDAELVVLHCNVGNGHHELEALWTLIESSGADIVFLQEFTPRLWDQLEPRLARYELAVGAPEQSSRGVGMLVTIGQPRRITGRVLRIESDERGRPLIEAAVQLSGLNLRLLSLHTKRLGSAEFAAVQAQELRAAAMWARDQRQQNPAMQLIILGDFNTTPWSARVTQLRREADLLLAGGSLLLPTWPASMPAPLRLPIDYALHSRGLTVTANHLGPGVGSDHLPILLRFSPALLK